MGHFVLTPNYTYFPQGKPTETSRILKSACKAQPGETAIQNNGSVWIAEGGDEKNGARSWRKYDVKTRRDLNMFEKSISDIKTSSESICISDAQNDPIAEAEKTQFQEIWQIELSIQNLEQLTAFLYENLSDLKLLVSNLKHRGNMNEIERHEINKQIAERQAKLATFFTG